MPEPATSRGDELHAVEHCQNPFGRRRAGAREPIRDRDEDIGEDGENPEDGDHLDPPFGFVGIPDRDDRDEGGKGGADADCEGEGLCDIGVGEQQRRREHDRGEHRQGGRCAPAPGVVAALVPDRNRQRDEADRCERGEGPTDRWAPAIDGRKAREQRAARVEHHGQCPEDATVRVGEVAPEDRRERDQGGSDENRRRPEPRNARCRPVPHALAAALVFFSVLRPYCLMNFSVFACASSSTIWTGGDFIR